MSLNAEDIAQRRLLRRRLTFWRVAAIILFVIAIGAFFLVNTTPLAQTQNHIARVTISGVIVDDRKQQEMLAKIAENDNVKAVILNIDSPGGTTTGGEALFEALQKISEKKPVISVFGTIATSAAYIAGLGTDYIVSRGNTITGSVGVIFQWAEVSELLTNLGVKVQAVKSGALKATPSPFEPTDEQGQQLVREMVEDAQKWFLRLVEDQRKLDPKTVPGLTEGRIYSGRQALDLKLVDEIGGETTAVTWLTEKRDIPKNLKIIDWKPEQENSLSFLQNIDTETAKLFGQPIEVIQKFFLKTLKLEKVYLDGLVSIWQH